MIEINVTKEFEDTQIHKIIELVKDSNKNKWRRLDNQIPIIPRPEEHWRTGIPIFTSCQGLRD